MISETSFFDSEILLICIFYLIAVALKITFPSLAFLFSPLVIICHCFYSYQLYILAVYFPRTSCTHSGRALHSPVIFPLRHTSWNSFFSDVNDKNIRGGLIWMLLDANFGFISLTEELQLIHKRNSVSYGFIIFTFLTRILCF